MGDAIMVRSGSAAVKLTCHGRGGPLGPDQPCPPCCEASGHVIAPPCLPLKRPAEAAPKSPALALVQQVA